jgi:hypothetical protein
MQFEDHNSSSPVQFGQGSLIQAKVKKQCLLCVLMRNFPIQNWKCIRQKLKLDVATSLFLRGGQMAARGDDFSTKSTCVSCQNVMASLLF